MWLVQKTRATFPTNQNKTQNHHDLVTRVSRASQFDRFYFEFSLAPRDIILDMIGCWIYAGSVLRHSIESPSTMMYLSIFFYFSSLDNLIASKPSRTEQGMIKLEKDAFRFCTFWNFRAQLVVLKPQDL